MDTKSFIPRMMLTKLQTEKEFNFNVLNNHISTVQVNVVLDFDLFFNRSETVSCGYNPC